MKTRSWLLVLLFALAYLIPDAYYDVNGISTEGLSIVPAREIQHGALYFRDFVTWTPPGLPYLLAGVFSLFGPSLLVARLLTTTLVKAGMVLMLYGIAGRLKLASRAKLVAVLFSTILLGTKTFSGNDYAGIHPTVLSTALVLASGCFMIEYFARARRLWLCLAGLAVGLNVLVRHDLALFSFFGHWLALALAAFRGPQRPGIPALRRAVPPYLLGVTGIVAPVAAYFLRRVSIEDLSFSMFAYARAYLEMAGPRTVGDVLVRLFPNPFPGAGALLQGRVGWAEFIRDWLLYDAFRSLVFAAYYWGWAWLALLWRRARSWSFEDIGLGSLILLGTCLWPYFLKSGNLLTFPVPAYLFLPALIWRHRDSASRAARWVSGFMLAWLIGLLGVALVCKPILPRPYHEWVRIPQARGTLLPANQARDLYEVVDYVQSRVPSGEKIFVTNERTDSGAPDTELLLYFFTDRRPGTEVFSLFTGVTSREEVQRRIIADLERSAVRAVVRVPSQGYADPSPGSRTLDQYFEKSFHVSARFGRYAVLVKGPKPAGRAEGPSPSSRRAVSPEPVQDPRAPYSLTAADRCTFVRVSARPRFGVLRVTGLRLRIVEARLSGKRLLHWQLGRSLFVLLPRELGEDGVVELVHAEAY